MSLPLKASTAWRTHRMTHGGQRDGPADVGQGIPLRPKSEGFSRKGLHGATPGWSPQGSDHPITPCARKDSPPRRAGQPWLHLKGGRLVSPVGKGGKFSAETSRLS